jgi:triacylglycerol lipase
MEPEMIRLLSRAAALVYIRQPQLPGWTVEQINRQSTTAYLIYNDTDIIVAFRGTDSQTDWKNDFRFKKIIEPGIDGKVHQGFSEALDQVFWQLMSRLHFLSHRRQLWVTGHSLGGALGALFAARLTSQAKEHQIGGVLTLGAPRVFNVRASIWYDRQLRSKTLRLENDGDEITHLPMAWMGFRHVGSRKVLYARDEHNRLWAWIRRWTFFTKRILRTKLVHGITRYLRRMERWVNTNG